MVVFGGWRVTGGRVETNKNSQRRVKGGSGWVFGGLLLIPD